MKRLPLLFCFILFLCNLNARQDVREVSFNVLLWAPFDSLAPGQSEPIPPDLWFHTEDEYVQVRATWNVPTPQFRYIGTSPLVFAVPSGGTAEQQNYNVVARVPLKESSRHYVLIFFQSSNGTYRVFPVDVGLQNMPPGSLKLINYGGDTIFAKVGEKVERMSHGEDWIIPTREARDFQLRMQLASQEEDGFRLVYRSSFAVTDDSSRMVFLIHRANLDRGPWRVRPIAGFDTVDRTTEPVDTEAMARDHSE